MSRLPGADRAVVADAKVRDYLLNPGNIQNRGKAALFEAFGFSRENWNVLREALASHAMLNLVADVSNSSHGTKYVVRCNMVSPDGRDPCMVTVWIIDKEQGTPRLVTSYAEQG